MKSRSNVHVAKLFATRRFAYFVPVDGYVEGRGYRAAIAFEGEPGYYPSGDWPYEGKVGQKAPWFWGHDYNVACEIAQETNERMGVSRDLALGIVTSSMAAKEPAS